MEHFGSYYWLWTLGNYFIALMSSVLAFCFMRSKDGSLRKILIFLFGSLSWLTLSRIWLTNFYVLTEDDVIIGSVSKVPLMIALVVFLYYVIRKKF